MTDIEDLSPSVKEAYLYEKLENDAVKCTACRQECIIRPGKTGICAVRMNKDGRLYLMVYGRAIGVHVDPVEKKPLYHFFPGTGIFSFGTVGCNFSCNFCQNWNISQVSKDIKQQCLREKHEEDLEGEITRLGHELPPESVIQICRKKGVNGIAYTYNEPTIFAEYILDTCKLAKQYGIRNVMVTNGYESDSVLEMLSGLVDAMNIDLKAFTEEFYRKNCHASLSKVLDTIRKAHELGFFIEITTLLIPEKNTADEEVTQLAQFIASIDTNIPWHISAFHPDYKMKDVPRTSADYLMRAYEIGKRCGLKYVYLGNLRLADKYVNTFCPSCNTLLVDRSGYRGSVLSNFVGGKCAKCGETIPGIFE